MGNPAGSWPALGKVKTDVSSAVERQFATVGEGDPSGGNSSGGNFKQPVRLQVAPFQGRSGQPDNQDTSRAKGHT